MPCQRCTICGIDYPYGSPAFMTCLVCAEATTPFTNVDMDPRWAEIVREKVAEENGFIALPLPELPRGSVLRRTAGRVPTVKEVLVIPARFVMEAGYTYRLPDLSVVSVQPHYVPDTEQHPVNDLWEILAYVESFRGYWVRPLKVPDHVPEEWCGGD